MAEGAAGSSDCYYTSSLYIWVGATSFLRFIVALAPPARGNGAVERRLPNWVN